MKKRTVEFAVVGASLKRAQAAGRILPLNSPLRTARGPSRAISSTSPTDCSPAEFLFLPATITIPTSRYFMGVPSTISRMISRAKDSSSGWTKIFLDPG
jgi:hypothetical protein